MVASQVVSALRSAPATIPIKRSSTPSASSQASISTVRSRRPRSARTSFFRRSTAWRKRRRASSCRPACQASSAAPTSAEASGSSLGVSGRAPRTRPRTRPTKVMVRSDVVSDGMTATSGQAAWRRRADGAGSTRRHALLFLHQPLAIDAITRERKRVESLVGDRLAAALAGPERSILDLLQRHHHFAQQPAIAVAQLEEKFPRVRRVRLIAEVFDRVVFLVLAVERRAPHLLDQLVLLVEQALFETRQPIFFHHGLRDSQRASLRWHHRAKRATPLT